MKKIALFLVAVVALLTACDPKEPSQSSNVTLTVKPTELTLKVGESSRIVISAEPAGDYEYEWKSADETIATVDNGVVTAVAKGETTVTVNIVGSTDVKTINVSVIGEFDAVKYWGLYLMTNPDGADSKLYNVKNEETGEETPIRPFELMLVPENFYVSAGAFAGSWDYPIFATTSVEDRRHLEGTGNERDGYIMVFGSYTVRPATESVMEVDGDKIAVPHYIVSDDFNQEMYEQLFHELFVLGNQDESVYEKYPYMSANSAIMYKMSFDEQGQMLAGYLTGEGLIYTPGYPEGDEVYFADIAYDFDVKTFGNIDYYGLEVGPVFDEGTGDYLRDEEGNVAMYFPTDEEGNPIIRMAEMTTCEFKGGSVEFPTEEEAAPCAGLTTAAIKKISSINNMMLKSVSYNRDFQKMIR